MGFLSYWPLAFLVLVPGIIILYILKQQTKEYKISSTLLWQETFKNMEASRPWEKLRKNLLMFLQILIVMVFVLALMGPWILSKSKEGQAVIVIDNSASMGSIYEGKTTRLEAAKESACEYIDSLPGNTVMHIITDNQESILLFSGSKDKMAAKDKIKGIQQTDIPGDLSTSLGMAESCINNPETANFIFFTDSAFEMGSMKGSVASFYSEGDNIALGEIGYELDSKKGYEVLVPVNSYTSNTATVDINLYSVTESGKEELIDVATVDISAKGGDSCFFQVKPDKLQDAIGLHAQINEADSLMGDNDSYVALSQVKEQKVLLLTKSNLFLEKAFGNIQGVTVFKTDDEKVIDDNEKYDLYIFDGIVPKVLPESGNFLFVNCESEKYVISSESLKSINLNVEDTEISSYIKNTTIGVNETLSYELPTWAKAFITSDDKVAAYYGTTDGHKIATMGFDLHQTDFGLKMEFPILIAGLSEYLMDGGLVEENSYINGESAIIHGNSMGDKVAVSNRGSNVKEFDVLESSKNYLQLEQTGIYNVTQKINGEKKQQSFVSLFPSETESKVTPANEMFVDNDNIASADIKKGVFELKYYIVFLLLLLMLVEWFVYQK